MFFHSLHACSICVVPDLDDKTSIFCVLYCLILIDKLALASHYSGM